MKGSVIGGSQRVGSMVRALPNQLGTWVQSIFTSLLFASERRGLRRPVASGREDSPYQYSIEAGAPRNKEAIGTPAKLIPTALARRFRSAMYLSWRQAYRVKPAWAGKSSMPLSMHFSRAPLRAWAVTPMIGLQMALATSLMPIERVAS